MDEQFKEALHWGMLSSNSARESSVINIPSGSGRLNKMLKKYFKKIDCVDAC